MKAIAVFPDEKKVSLVDHPEPGILAPDDVKIRIVEVGVCGTDREIVSFEYGVPPAGCEYLILGHESLGEVVEAGKNVTRLEPGDLAVTTVRRPCAELCRACAFGRQDFCYTGDYHERGIMKQHGFMTEYIVESETYVNPVSAALRHIGVLTEPLTIAEKAYDQLDKIQLRMPWMRPDTSGQGSSSHTALVLGAGPVGLLGAMKFAIEGFRTFVYSRGAETEKPPIVKAMGATFIATEQVKPEELSEACGGQVDVVYEAMGAPGLAFDVIEQLDRNSIFIFTGVPGQSNPMPVSTSSIMRDMVLKNQMIFGTVNASPAHFASAITDLERFHAKFPDAIGKLITNRYAMEQFKEPILGHGGIKNVISVSAQ